MDEITWPGQSDFKGWMHEDEPRARGWGLTEDSLDDPVVVCIMPLFLDFNTLEGLGPTYALAEELKHRCTGPVRGGK